MNAFQKFILIISFITLFIGSIIIVLSNLEATLILLLFYTIIGLPSFLLYLIFKEKKSSKKEPANIPKELTAESKSEELSQSGNQLLYEISTFWPFVFFTDYLVIREKSISYINKLFFFSVWSDTLPLKLLTGIVISTGFFFASLTIMRKDPKKEYQLNYLKKNEAIKAHEIIDGLLILKENNIKIPNKLSIEKKVKFIRNYSKEYSFRTEMKKL